MIQLGSTVQGLPCNVDIYPAGREIPIFYVTQDSLPCSQKSAVLSPFYPVQTFH
jgi:hypothetical protein